MLYLEILGAQIVKQGAELGAQEVKQERNWVCVAFIGYVPSSVYSLYTHQ